MRVGVGEPYFRVQQYATVLTRLSHRVDLLDLGRLPGGTWGKLLGALRQLAASARAFARYDVVLVTPHPLVSMYVMLAKILRRKVIIDQILTYVSHQEVFPGFPRALDALTYRLADGILTHSETMRRELTAGFGIGPKRLEVAYPVLDLDLFSPRYEAEAAALRNALGITDRFVVMYHGMWHPWHGLSYIYEAARLLQSHPRIVFVIIPKDSEPNRGNVLFVEEQPFERLPAYLQMADVWCSGFDSDTRGERAFSSTLIQALALGLPVITGRAGERAAVLRDGVEARLVALRDPRAIAAAELARAASPAVARAMGARARVFAQEHFSIERLSRALSALLARLD
ncbi:MAG: glycosyltransferase [Candidatus Rokubacteria bacterium]|nr:glycosyltransferase [Candidatus Rokubacteria bacterium]